MNRANSTHERSGEVTFAAPCVSPPLAFLCACVRGGAPATLRSLLAASQEAGKSLYRTACRHGLAPLAYLKLRDAGLGSGLPPEEWIRLRQTHERTASRQTLLYAAGHELIRLLGAAGLPWVLPVKGLALGALLWPEYLPRDMEDLDLLVPADRLEAAERTLREVGFVDANAPPAAWAPHHHARTLQRGVAFPELHWALWTPETLPLPHPDPESIERRAVAGALNVKSVRVPHPADGFILTAGALARDRFAAPLRNWADLYWLLTHGRVGLETGALLDQAGQLGLGLFTTLMVRLVGRLFGDERLGAIPCATEVADAATQLQPIVMRRLCQGTHRADRHALLLQLAQRARLDTAAEGARPTPTHTAHTNTWGRRALGKAAGYVGRLVISRRQRTELREELAINRILVAVAKADSTRT